VIILLGANDFFRQRPAKDTKADLQDIINKLGNQNRKIFLASFIGGASWEASIFGTIPGLSSSVFAALLSDYKKMFAELTTENRDITFIPDIWTGVWGIHMSDPVHPNAEGYEIIANTVFNAIKPALAN
jgi:acyl-CoA thioesterase-1